MPSNEWFTSLFEKIRKSDYVAFEHEFYDDSNGGRQHCWFVTYETWAEYSFGKPDLTFIATKQLIYSES